MDLLIIHGTVVTMDEERRILEDGAVAIRGNRIVAVGDTPDLVDLYKEFETLDVRGKVVFPGLVNTHTHLFQGLLKGLGDDRVLVDWFRQVTGPSAVELLPEDCYHAARLGCLESICSGATTLLDFMYPHNRPGLSEPIIRAFQESGIRGIYARGYVDYGTESGVPEPILETAEEALADCRDLFERYDGSAQGRIHIWVAPCMIWTQTAEGLRATRQLADELGMRISVHVSETPFEIANAQERFGLKDLEYLASIGFLGPDVLAVHCVYLDARDIRILRKHDVKVSHNPVSNMYLSSGVAPIPQMLMAGVTVGIATDGPASNNNQNMIQALKFTALLHKVATRDPTVITAEKVAEMATIDGARAVGLEDEVGSLEVGKKADLIVLDFNNPFAGPVHHPVSTLVYSAIGNEVVTSIIDGEIIMHEGQVRTMDEEEVLRAAQDAADGLAERAGTIHLRHRPWRSLAY